MFTKQALAQILPVPAREHWSSSPSSREGAIGILAVTLEHKLWSELSLQPEVRRVRVRVRLISLRVPLSALQRASTWGHASGILAQTALPLAVDDAATRHSAVMRPGQVNQNSSSCIGAFT